MLEPVIDWLSEKSGWAAVREPLRYASGPDEVTLSVPGYVQTNSFACAVVAGFMVLKTFKPRSDFEAFYAKVSPDPECGCGRQRLSRALRSFGIGVKRCARLKLSDLRQTIDDGFPIIASIQNPGREHGHWIVIYGYGKNPSRIFLATNGIPLFNRNVVSAEKFQRIWEPRGNGLICWGK